LPAGDAKAGSPAGRVANRAIAPPEDALAAAIALVASARRPLFIVGNGARHHMDAVIALAEQIGAPVATTFKAKGRISDHHPLGCGVLGRSGTPIASWFMNECEVVLAWGASFSNHTGIASYKPLHNPDFAAFAQLCGAAGYRVSSAGQLAQALTDALAQPGPALVEVVADPLLV
ncbi:MAG: thiamine pyrophosphate-dependent enzyme, partial [Acidimicrobiales bacterium]